MAAGTEERLRRHALLDSSDLDEVRAGVAGVLNDHLLTPRHSALHARLYAKGGEHLKVCMLEYGRAVTVRTEPATDFLIVQSAVRGSVTVRSPAGTWTVRPGSGVILPSGMSLQLDWEDAALQILVKIPLSRVECVYESLAGRPSPDTLNFEPELCFDTAAGASWGTLVNYYCDQIEQASSPTSRMRTRIAEDTLIGHLLCSYSPGLAGDLESRRKIAPKHVRRAREFIESHLSDPITLTDIANAAGVSPRSLSRAYQEHYDTSPMAAVRQLRLDRIHADLMSSHCDGSVSDIALRRGYLHLGRFAAAYRARFGQAPYETLRRGRGGSG